MKRLFFDINGQFRRYTCLDYKVENDFYIFTDIHDGVERSLHRLYLRGIEDVKK